MKVDFQSLRNPRLDCASQEVMPITRIKKMALCAIHYCLYFGLVARFLGGGIHRCIKGHHWYFVWYCTSCGPRWPSPDAKGVIPRLTLRDCLWGEQREQDNFVGSGQPEICIRSSRHCQQNNEQGREINPCGAIPFMDGAIFMDGSSCAARDGY